MQKSIQNKREKRHSKCTVTVMLHGRAFVFGGFLPFRVRKGAVMSLSEPLKAVAQSALMSRSTYKCASRRCASPFQATQQSYLEKFYVETPQAFSASSVVGAVPIEAGQPTFKSNKAMRTEQFICIHA